MGEHPYDADAFSLCALELLFTEEPEVRDMWVFRRVLVLQSEEFEEFGRRQQKSDQRQCRWSEEYLGFTFHSSECAPVMSVFFFF